MGTKGPISPSSHNNSETFLLSSMLLATLLLPIQLLILPVNMHFKPFFIVGLQNLDLHNISVLIEVLNI